MKLDHNCVRDLLLYLEDNLKYNDKININNLTLKNYNKQTLMYTADRLIEAEYINPLICWNCNEQHVIIVKSITYQGHQFLDTIRDKSVWETTKSKISKFTSVSLPIIQQVASNYIKSKLGL